MKTGIMIHDGITQLFFTSENEGDKAVLKFLDPKMDIHVAIHDTNGIYDRGQFEKDPTFNVNIGESRGGILRVYKDNISRVLVIKEKVEDPIPDPTPEVMVIPHEQTDNGSND